MILVDTNVVLRSLQPDHPHHHAAAGAIRLLVSRGEALAFSTQSLFEMYVVCTRPPDQNGLGMSPEAAHAELERAAGFFAVLPEPATLFHTWTDLIKRYGIIGKTAHDVRFVALMIQRDIRQILTFNIAHFQRFTEIQPICPFDLLGLPKA